MTFSPVRLGDSINFPDPELALHSPNGLLAVGGDLAPERLLNAYHQGIFPWFSNGQPPLWWSPDPRAVLLPGSEHWSRSLRKHLRHTSYHIDSDRRFAEVISACATNRRDGTWILPEVQRAYIRLHHEGWAHSIEVYQEDRLVGGLYGIAIGTVFCGESMFSREPNASKLAFLAMATVLFRAGFSLVDAQIENTHLRSLGVTTIPRRTFLRHLHTGSRQPLPWPSIACSSHELLVENPA